MPYGPAMNIYAEQWIQALIRLSADATLRTNMGNKGKVFIQQRYSINHSFQIMKTCLETLFSGKP